MKLEKSCIYLIVVLSSLLKVSQSELLTIGLSLTAAAAAGSLGIYFDKIKQHTYCKFAECCLGAGSIPHNIQSLQYNLKQNLYGQHIIEEKVFKAVASHYKEIEKSEKPLVMSFHGTQGTGKNFVSNMIAEAVFKEGSKSRHYHVFHGSQYGDSEKTNSYQQLIKEEIDKAIGICPYSIFVFDEIDKMPRGIFDSISAMLDHHVKVKGKDFRKAIFIFLTNYGGEEISKVLFHLTNKKGLYRHESQLHHFEEITKIGVYNSQGGLEGSRLISSAVIDFYLPFLPLEEKHVVQCIKAEYKKFGRYDVLPEMVSEILKYIGFNSVTKYANTGCKTIHSKVRTECF